MRAIAAVFLCCMFVHLGARGGDAPTADDEAFFEQIKSAVSKNDAGAFAKLISYPFLLRTRARILKLENAADVKKNFAIICTTRVKSAVEKQAPDSLFKNSSGVMIGNGEIWFSQVQGNAGAGESWVYRIIAINPDGVRRVTRIHGYRGGSKTPSAGGHR